MSPGNPTTFDTIIDKLNETLLEQEKPLLNTTEILVLKGIWQNQTYYQMAQQGSYSAGYLTNVVAPKLWRRLSEVMGQRVTKKNCRTLLQSYFANPPTLLTNLNLDSMTSLESITYPSGTIPLNSPFYINRFPLEEQSCAEIKKPGALVRIKAPQEMGKTSLLIRILEYSKTLGYHTVNLNLQQADEEILSNINRFLRWICANIRYQLQIQSKLDEYWDEDIGSSVSCSLYLHNILEQLETPLVLAFDDVNHVFEYPKIAKSFLPLLRSWHEETKDVSLWQKLRLVVIHSTEVYVPLQLNQSPFSNVGLPLEVPNFRFKEVQELAQRYRLCWGEQEVNQLMSVIAGHPKLVHLTFYYLTQKETTLSQLLQDAETHSGIYASHLQRHQATLDQQPALANACYQVMNAQEPVSIEPILAYKLYSMGLIDLERDRAFPRIPLYQTYFKDKLKPTNQL